MHHYNIKRIHFIGIGGAGMCGIAEILVRTGYYVTGSDTKYSNILQYLKRLGIKIFFTHHRKNINNADVVVVSNAIPPNNPEILSAKERCIPIIKRAEMLSELMRFKYGIVVSGTHGKTTTTTMIANIYSAAGLDPTCVNGGLIKSEGTYACLGYSRYLIAEADESDCSFLCLYPIVAVITNIDIDHIQAYKNNFELLKQAFVNFLHNLPFYGYAIVCIDDPAIRDILPKIKRKIITYGFSKNAHLHIFNYRQYINKSNFVILHPSQKKLRITLNAPGHHNALNAAAAVAAATIAGIDDQTILKTMLHFQGTHRRFENLGYYSLKKINGKTGSIILIDDYGHHPTELQATIKTVRTGWPNNRLIMIFQPHRYTRTQILYNNFVKVLSTVDVLLMLSVYSAGETPIFGADSKSLCNTIYKCSKIHAVFVPNTQKLSDTLNKILQDNDLLLIQGAGTIGNIIRKLIIKNNDNTTYYI
ncbi:UDP-N-acetylmuramate--L-alanine ligase [Candidatus Blochmannia ocreatus (nom. nud.)]|uniref:UDP-N-acetylmuramate--L-alanine ligase n=1 Tax=Candidatus Blochmannia ocreatus (nom. nud.) TaxID=251538 RepID=A0ABY4SUY2_9ENTR|nr:UDP-N-acetylmuramate--L-alanine ligase [Candidatus Blochmannia ocreatus]URJ25224.1 UDP-N-acetylmuramate--L-alanine ligase [Candidatus Blochmannia ocreatus]